MLSKIKNYSFAAADNKLHKPYLVKLSILDLSKKRSLTQFSIVYSKAILVKRLSRSRLAIISLCNFFRKRERVFDSIFVNS